MDPYNILLERINKQELTLTAFTASVQIQMSTLTDSVKGLTESFNTSRTPRQVNWVGIVSVGFAGLALIGSFSFMWLAMTLRPIEKDMQILQEQLKALKQSTERELTWQYDKFDEQYESMRGKRKPKEIE